MNNKTQCLLHILQEFRSLTKNPELYLSVQNTAQEEIKSLTKKLYDLTKNFENKGKYKNTLPSLVIESFDEEQIWQELELQNNCICDGIVADVAHIIAKKGRLKLELTAASSDDDGGSDMEEEDDKEGEEDEEEDADNEDRLETEDESDESEHKVAETAPHTKQAKPSIVDDQFFKLRDMEKFLEKMENKAESSASESEEDIDYFAGEASESDSNDNESSLRCRYKDFFDAPQEASGKKRRRNDSEEGSEKKKSKSEKKSVKFNVEDDSSEEENAKEKKVKSLFEARQERLKARIEALEDEALGVKPWQMQGEVSGVTRPQNSLLEEYVEFDIASRPAPIITEQVTIRLEQVIQQRIKDKAWDNVERKVKSIEEVREYKKRLVLNQEKSKLSLAEIYEQEFIKQRDGAAAEKEGRVEEVEEEPAAHVEIKKMLRGLVQKLDALCNFHYTPKQVAPEVKIVSNLPAVAMEEVAPVAVSDAMLLAPEEVKKRAKGDVKGKGERTVTDKKRARRQKKIGQRLRQKEREKREKTVAKLNPGLGNKYSKEKAAKMLEKATKEGNVTAMKEGAGKYVKSSKTFFSQLQDEVTSHMKKTSEKVTKKKPTKFSTKKLKL